MTDQEAKNIIVDLAFNEQRIQDDREVEALRKGVIAINEAQAYREIGTVREFKYLKDKSVPEKPKGDEGLNDRDCDKCIHHIGGSCNAWECQMQTLEDYRNKVIDEFISRLAKYQQDNFAAVLRKGITWSDIKIVAEQMKGCAE